MRLAVRKKHIKNIVTQSQEGDVANLSTEVQIMMLPSSTVGKHKFEALKNANSKELNNNKN